MSSVARCLQMFLVLSHYLATITEKGERDGGRDRASDARRRNDLDVGKVSLFR